MKTGKMEIESFNCTLTPLTPIHIGSGQELLPFEYIIKDGKYYRIEPSEIYDSLSLAEQAVFQEEIEKGMIPFRNYLFKIYKKEQGYLYCGDVEGNFEIQYKKKIGGASRPNEENQLIIKEFIGNHRGKLIPGSSIKGSLRTAFLSLESEGKIRYKLGRNEKVKTKPFILMDDNGKFELRRNDATNRAKEIEAGILGLSKLEPKIDPFKFVKVGDTQVKDDLVKVCEVVRMPVNPEKSATPMGAMEVTKSLFCTGEEISLNFNISFKYLEMGMLKSNSSRETRDIIEEKQIYSDTLIEYLNIKAEKMLKTDLEFFKKSETASALEVCKKLQSTLENLEDGEALIRLGQGAGFDSSTFSLYNSFRDPMKDEPRTRVLAEKKFPMGWGIIRFNER